MGRRPWSWETPSYGKEYISWPSWNDRTWGHRNRLADFTKCNVASRVLSQESDLGDTTPPGVGANTDKRGVYVLRDDDSGQEIEVVIPAIKDALIDTSAPEGDRIISADVASMASQVATATGKTISGIYGYVLGLE